MCHLMPLTQMAHYKLTIITIIIIILTEGLQKLNVNFTNLDMAKGMFLLFKVPRTPIKGVFRECMKL